MAAPPPAAWQSDGLPGFAPLAVARSAEAFTPLSDKAVEAAGHMLDQDDLRPQDLVHLLRNETGPPYTLPPAGVRREGGACRPAAPPRETLS